MKMMKKLMAVALAGVMALTLLAGCGSMIEEKEIVACLSDAYKARTGKSISMTAVSSGEAVKAANTLKEYQAEHPNETIDSMLGYYNGTATTVLRAALKAEDETDYIVVSYAKLEEYQSKLYSERKNMVIAQELVRNGGTVYEAFDPTTAKEATVSLTVEKFGDDNYVIAVIRLKAPAGD